MHENNFDFTELHSKTYLEKKHWLLPLSNRWVGRMYGLFLVAFGANMVAPSSKEFVSQSAETIFDVFGTLLILAYLPDLITGKHHLLAATIMEFFSKSKK